MNKDKLNLGKSWNEWRGNKSSKCVNGMWFHIEWKGETGTDQHGRKWSNRDNPTCNDLPIIEAITGTTKSIIELTTNAKLI